jgi:hypothetical protein
VALGNLQGLHAAAYRPKEEDRNILQKAPWALEISLEILKTALVLQDFVIQTSSKSCEIF